MSNVKFLVPNWCERNWCSIATPTADPWYPSGAVAPFNVSTLPNLLDPDFGTAAQSQNNGASGAEFAIDFVTGGLHSVLGFAPGIDVLMIPKHNLTQTAQIRLKLGTAPFTSGGAGGGTVLYDSGNVSALPPLVYAPGTVPWGHVSGFTGAPDPVMDVGNYNRAVVHQLPSTIQADYGWVLVVDLSMSVPLQLYRLLLAPAYQPALNMSFGAALGFNGTRVADETVTNAEIIDPNRLLRRVWNFTLDDIPVDEAMAYFMGIQSYLRYGRQGGLIFDPADTYHMQRRSFMFTLLKPGDIGHPYYNGATVPLSCQEVI